MQRCAFGREEKGARHTGVAKLLLCVFHLESIASPLHAIAC